MAGERILASSKSNLGPPLPALRYRIAARTPGSAVPAVEWLGPCDYTAATLLGDGVTDAATAHAGRTSAVEEAAAWLRVQLAAGSRPAAELLSEAREQGFSDWALRRCWGCRLSAPARRGVQSRSDGWRGRGADHGDVHSLRRCRFTYHHHLQRLRAGCGFSAIVLTTHVLTTDQSSVQPGLDTVNSSVARARWCRTPLSGRVRPYQWRRT